MRIEYDWISTKNIDYHQFKHIKGVNLLSPFTTHESSNTEEALKQTGFEHDIMGPPAAAPTVQFDLTSLSIYI